MLAKTFGGQMDVRKPRNHGCDVIVGGELFTDCRSPSQTCHAKLWPNQQAPDATSFFPLVGCLPQAAWPERLLSEKSGRCGVQQIKERGALPMIDRGDIRQAIDRCSNIWASLPGAGYGQFEHKADSLIAKFKEAGGTVRRDWCMSRVTAIISLWLSASSSACHGLLIITVITPLPTKAQRDKNAEKAEAGERGNYWHADASAMMLLRSMQNTRRS